MNYYIIFTGDIHPVGGMQLYTAGKAKFLTSRGFEVVVYSPIESTDGCAFRYLNRFTRYCHGEFRYPPHMLSQTRVRRVLASIENDLSDFGYSKCSSDKVYVESQDDVSAFWGEMTAECLNGRHINFNVNELFRGKGTYYEQYMDFFIFKYRRREIVGNLTALFDGYLIPEYTCNIGAPEPEAVQDVYDERLANINRLDYNILYIGRAEKGYVPNIIIGVAKFAKEFPDKKIRFMMVGDATSQMHLLKRELSLNNVILSLFGDMVPIPKKIYSLCDVVIAGSGCARASVFYGVPVIVADCKDYMADGILGYTTDNSLHTEKNKQMPFADAINDALIEKKYKQMPFVYTEKGAENTDEIYEELLNTFDKSSKTQEYYDFKDHKRDESTYKRFKAYIWLNFPWMRKIYKKIKELCNGVILRTKK